MAEIPKRTKRGEKPLIFRVINAALDDGLGRTSQILDVDLHPWTPVRGWDMGWHQCIPSSYSTPLESNKSVRGTVSMEFNYGDHFGSEPSTGCEILQYGAMIGDIMLFQRNDIVEATWTMATPILDV